MPLVSNAVGSGPGQRPSRLLLWLSTLTVLAAFALVTLGGVVRTTGSGLGCPDWPLCHGRIIPPLSGPALIEYSHRLVASAVGFLVVATWVLVWRSHRREHWLSVPATLGLVLLGPQVVLGGIAVLQELPPVTVLVHLGLAEALAASMLVVSLMAWRARDGAPLRARTNDGLLTVLAVGLVLVGFGLVLSGAYVTASGAMAACSAWPLCRGTALFPAEGLPIVHMLHRLVAGASAVLLALTLVLVWRRRADLRSISLVTGGLYVAQVMAGAAMVWLHFSPAVRALHLGLATAVWLAMAALAVLVRVGARHAVPSAGTQADAPSGTKRSLTWSPRGERLR
ncbi:MAG: heme A synthase [Chloroflexi bacterium]|nr:heme A synthase [Chloroflexota bacterium]